MGPCCSKKSFDAPIVAPGIEKLGEIEDVDLIIVGGGSAGIAAAREVGQYNFKALVCDYVEPTPLGTTWGLGGTCINVGCIPKKLMHFAALTAQTIHNSEVYGFSAIHRPSDNDITKTIANTKFNWTRLVEEIQNHVHSQNWKSKVTLRENKIEYVNKAVEFVDSYTLEILGNGETRKFVRGKTIIVAAGGRPRYLNIPGGRKEDGICITSDDLFSLTKHPGNVLIIGAGYIAMECAGFLHGLGMFVTVMVRDKVLRNFDQEIVKKLADHLKWIGIKFLMPSEPTEIKRIDANTIEVIATSKESQGSQKQFGEKFNTVLLAIGRDPCTEVLKVANAGLKCNEKNQRIIVNPSDQTNIKHIYALGDIADGHMELTPVATHSAKYLIRRLYGNSKQLTNYSNVPTTIFTPIEYACIGLSEEEALEKYGQNNVNVYPKSFMPLQYALPNQDPGTCFAKLICVKSLKERVVGLHYFGPDAGEVIQGYQIGFRLGAKKSDFDSLIGIHPTCAELFTVMKYNKASGHADESEQC